MRKVGLDVLETLKYQREIIVQIPEDVSEEELNNAIDKAQRGEYLDDFIFSLGNSGIQCLKYDESFDSPYSSEVECDNYLFIKDDSQ